MPLMTLTRMPAAYIFRCLKGRHARDKFAMGAIHVTVPKQVAIGPSHGIAAALSNGPG